MIVSQPDRVLLQQQIAAFAPRLSGDLLDVGGGDGKRYRSMFAHVSSYRTLDTDASKKPDFLASAEQIPLADGSVDCVLSTQMLEHVPHPQRVMQEMSRVLRTGGLALITAPQWNELHEEPHDYFRYTKHGLTVLAQDAGFAVLEMSQRGKYHACRAQERIRWWIDALQPYQQRWAMLLLGPLSRALTAYALWRDRHDTRACTERHAIGWALLLQKES